MINDSLAFSSFVFFYIWILIFVILESNFVFRTSTSFQPPMSNYTAIGHMMLTLGEPVVGFLSTVTGQL